METMKIKDLFLLEVFLNAHKYNSFSKAAEKLGVTSSVVSKKISQLESNLGVTLFQRTTRKIHLTEEGHKLLKTSELIIDEIKELEQNFEKQSGSKIISGTIRISSAETYANARLIKLISLFSIKYPEIKIDLILTNNYLNLVEENIDVSLRIYKPTDSSMKAFRVESNDLIFCASQEYLKKHKKIKTTTQLKDHPIMFLKSHGTEKLKSANKTINSVFRKSNISVNSGEAINQLAMNHYGIAIRSRWDVQRYIDEGKLVELKINDSIVSTTNIYALFKEGMYLPKRVRMFLDFLKENTY